MARDCGPGARDQVECSRALEWRLGALPPQSEYRTASFGHMHIDRHHSAICMLQVRLDLLNTSTRGRLRPSEPAVPGAKEEGRGSKAWGPITGGRDGKGGYGARLRSIASRTTRIEGRMPRTAMAPADSTSFPSTSTVNSP